MDDVKRITEMEEILDETRQALEVLHDARDAAFRMLEIGTDILKNRI